MSKPNAREDHILDVIGSASPSRNGHRPKVPDTEMDIPYEREQWARPLIHEVPCPVLTPIREAIGDETTQWPIDVPHCSRMQPPAPRTKFLRASQNIPPDGRRIRSSPA